MRKMRFTGLLLKPSTGSLIGVISLSLLILLVSALSHGSKTGLVYEFLFGPGSSAQLIETSRTAIEAFNETVFGNEILNKLLFFVFWMFIGLVVYSLLSGLGRGLSVADETVHEFGYVNAHKKRIGEELSLRIFLRSVALLAWFMYGLFFVKYFFPFSILCSRIALGSLDTLSGWLFGILGLFVLTVSIHLHVVFLRFLLLRPRIIGGWEDVIIEEDADHLPD